MPNIATTELIQHNPNTPDALSELGSARKPNDNPLTLMWSVLLGLPAALFFILLFKLSN